MQCLPGPEYRNTCIWRSQDLYAFLVEYLRSTSALGNGIIIQNLQKSTEGLHEIRKKTKQIVSAIFFRNGAALLCWPCLVLHFILSLELQYQTHPINKNGAVSGGRPPKRPSFLISYNPFKTTNTVIDQNTEINQHFIHFLQLNGGIQRLKQTVCKQI